MKRQGIVVRIRCYFMDQGCDWAGLQQATEIKVYEASRSLSHSFISASPCEFVRFLFKDLFPLHHLQIISEGGCFMVVKFISFSSSHLMCMT